VTSLVLNNSLAISLNIRREDVVKNLFLPINGWLPHLTIKGKLCLIFTFST